MEVLNPGQGKMAKSSRKADASEDRLRMAQKYLAEMKGVESEADSVDSDQEVDAREADREIIASRVAGREEKSSSVPVAMAQQWSTGELKIKRVKLAATPTACCQEAGEEGFGWVATKGGEVMKVDLDSGRIVWHRRDKAKKSKAGILSMAQRGDRLVTGDQSGKVTVWHAKQGKALLSHQQHRGAVTAIAFPSGKDEEYFTASVDRSVRVWLVDQPTALDTLFGHQDAILGLVAHPTANDRCLTVGSRDRTARLWRIAEESQLVFRCREQGEGGSLMACAMLASDAFVTGSDEGHLSLWSLGRKKPMFTVQPDQHAVNALHAHGDLLISGHAGWIGLWQVTDTLSLIRRIECNGHVNGVSLHAQRLLVAVGRDERMGRFVKIPAARNELLIITL